MPKLNMLTTQQVAEYYECAVGTIKGCYSDNRKEIDGDGTKTATIKDLLKLDFPTLEKTQYQTTFQIGKDNNFRFTEVA